MLKSSVSAIFKNILRLGYRCYRCSKFVIYRFNDAPFLDFIYIISYKKGDVHEPHGSKNKGYPLKKGYPLH